MRGVYYTGTTTIALTVEDAVVVAADRRVTESYSKKIAHKVGKKILEIDEHVVTTIAGGVADAQYIVDQLRAISKLYSMDNNKKYLLEVWPISLQFCFSMLEYILISWSST
jgi:20S proteasome, alpha and beta subunits